MICLQYWQQPTSIVLIVILPCLINNASSRSEYASQQQIPETEETISLAEDCARECRSDEKSRVCYYKFTLEIYGTMGRACDFCKPNYTNPLTNIPHCQCIEADGFERSVLSVNRMVPGPCIQVCKGDIIKVDVVNKMPAMSTGLHWHGMLQQNYQYYDGVPFVTQCPIESGTSFRYEFSADTAGTHFWHAHDGLHKSNGLYGCLIVREPADPNANLYDKDPPPFTIVISDWMHEFGESRFPGRSWSNQGQSPETILINGKGRWTDPSTNETTSVQLATFTVEHGKRYRFRIINSFYSICSAEITIEGHSLKLIAQDGVSVHPIIVNAIKFWSGERADFVVHANCSDTSYLIHVRASCYDKDINQVAILICEGGPDIPGMPGPGNQSEMGEKVIYNPDDDSCNVDRSHAICPNQVIPIAELPEGLLTARPDYEIHISIRIDSFENNIQDLFAAGQYQRFLQLEVGKNLQHVTTTLNNISFVFPRVPPLLQPITANDTCNQNHLPENCNSPCECPHTYDIKIGAIVEVCLWNTVSGLVTHPFHLHGYHFYVFSLGHFENGSISEDNIQAVLNEHKTKLETGQYSKPGEKDTIAVPKDGYVILRFKADNPGWWLFHCHFLYHTVMGMDLLFHVGDEGDLPPRPAHFRECGNFA